LAAVCSVIVPPLTLRAKQKCQKWKKRGRGRGGGNISDIRCKIPYHVRRDILHIFFDYHYPPRPGGHCPGLVSCWTPLLALNAEESYKRAILQFRCVTTLWPAHMLSPLLSENTEGKGGVVVICCCQSRFIVENNPPRPAYILSYLACF